MTNRRAYPFLVIPGTLFLVTFLFVPLFSIIVFSFWRTENYVMIQEWNLDNYRVILTDETYLVFLLRSLLMSTIVSIVCLACAWPLAFYIARHGGQHKLILLLLTAAPFLTGEILRVTALQQIIGPIGLVNMTLAQFGWGPFEILMYSNFATGLGLVYLWLPFMILAIYLSLRNFDFRLLDVADSAGARPLRAFFAVTWPLNRAGSAIGFVLVFIPTLASSLTSQFLGGPNGALYGNVLSHQFGATGTWALGSAMTVVLFAIAGLLIGGVWIAIGDLKKSGISLRHEP